MASHISPALVLTLKVALCATSLVFIPGVFLGYYFDRKESKWTHFLSSLCILPLVLPPTAVGFMLLSLLAFDGPLGSEHLGFDLNILLTWKASVIASAVMCIPLVIRTAKIAFESVDPQLESMARTLGYSKTLTFFKITLPLAARGLIAAFILGFTRAFGEFGASVIVAGNIPGKTQTLASAIFSAQEVGQSHEAFILILISVSFGFVAIYSTEQLAKRSKVKSRC